MRAKQIRPALMMLLLTLCVFSLNCGGGGASAGKVTAVSMKISAEKAGSVAKIRFTITAADMETIVRTVDVSGGPPLLVTEHFEVPNGLDRHIAVETLDGSGVVVHRGGAVADLDGRPKTVVVNLTPVFHIADYFPLGRGDTWVQKKTCDFACHQPPVSLRTTRNVTNTVFGTENIQGVVAVKHGDEKEYDLVTNTDGLVLYKRYNADDSGGWTQFVFDRPVAILPENVQAGTRHSVSFSGQHTTANGGATTGTGSFESLVEGTEDVTVPAGTFQKALRVHIRESRTSSGGNFTLAHDFTLWLAPGVGIVKESGIRSTTRGSATANAFTDTETRAGELIYASVGGVTYGEQPPPPPPSVPLAVLVSDPAGDAQHFQAMPPDLVEVAAVADQGIIAFSILFAPGTFNPGSTGISIMADTDRNVNTGHPGIAASGQLDGGVLGVDYMVNLYFGCIEASSTLRYAGTLNQFEHVSGAPQYAIQGDNVALVVPLSQLGGGNGNIRFKVIVQSLVSGGTLCGWTGITDVIPDLGQPPAELTDIQLIRSK